MEQRTIEWFKARLGKITGSKVGDIMKGKEFSETAKTYMYQLAAERTMYERIITNDTLFEEYITAIDNTTRSMRFGTEQEPMARLMYASLMNVSVKEVGSIEHPDMPFFASSPDGIYSANDELVTIEIKCPNQSTYMRYKHLVKDANSLKRVKPEYYWQCISHMAVTGSVKTDFVVFCPWQSDPLLIVPIKRDESEILALTERVKSANDIINNIINESNGESN